MIKREKAIVSTLSNLATSFLTLFLSLATGIIITRALGPELKGEYANLKLITSLYAPFLIFGYQSGVLYYGIRKEIQLERFFWAGWLLLAVLSTGIAFLLFPLVKMGIFGAVASQSLSLNIMIALVAVPFILLNSYCERVIRSYHLFHASNIRTIAGVSITLLFYIALLLFHKIDLPLVLTGLVLGQVVQLAMNLYFIIRYVKVNWEINFDRIFKPWKYGIQVMFNKVISKSNDKFDRIILVFLLNASSFGIYTVGVGLSNLVTTLPSSYVNVFYNQITERNPQQALSLYARAQRITFLITLGIATLLAVLSYPLIYLMYGTAFTDAAWVVVLYSPGLVFQVAARLSIKFYAGQGRPLKNSLVYLVGLAISVPFYFWLVPLYGINGAAIASSIAYFSAFAFSFYQIHREYGLPLQSIFRFSQNDLSYILVQLNKIPVLGKYLGKSKNRS